MGLRATVRHLEDLLFEQDLRNPAFEMEELLAEADIHLDPDLSFEEYMGRLQYLSDVFEEVEVDPVLTEAFGFGMVGAAAKKAAPKVKKGFKKVFGKLVKIGKKQGEKLWKKAKKRYSHYMKQRARKRTTPASAAARSKKPAPAPGAAA